MKQTAECGTCPHYLSVALGKGECHAIPPFGLPVMGMSSLGEMALQGVVTVYPPVNSGAVGCGSHPEWKTPPVHLELS